MNEGVPLSSSKLFSNSKKSFSSGSIMRYSDISTGAVYTVDDAVNKAGYGWFQILLTFLAGLGWLADAFEIIILSIIGDLIACDWVLLRWENALLTSVVFLGMMAGSPVFGTLADVYGRRKSLMGSITLLFIFGSLSAASPSYAWMAFFRGMMGFALGGVAQGLTLCSEYFPSNIRGKAGFYLCYFWSAGTICVILMSWGIMYYLDNWRVLLAAAAIPALFVILSLKWYPESARYFLVSNQYDKAEKILQRMAQMNGTDPPHGRLIDVGEVTKRGRIADLLSPEYRRSSLIFWYIWLATAFTYYGVTLITPIIIKQGTIQAHVVAGHNETDLYGLKNVVPCVKFTHKNYIDLLWTSAAEFPGLLSYTYLVEHCNRKVLLSVSCALSSILVFLLLIETKYSIITLIFLFAARGVCLAEFQLIFVMTSEAFPTTLRAIAMGTGSSFCRLGGLVIPYVAQVLVIENPVAAICLLGSVIMLAAVAAAFLPLETRGVDLKESHKTTE